ncbi:hypothetical protein LCGC14_0374020 [marine sediment metagenome]|uniref:Uncharacterized protein n=1 Tax=marine sediment metagenome TaxID=412755 RepID=A0A0F9TM63_9ZZZZ
MKKAILKAKEQWDRDIDGISGKNYGEWYTYEYLIKIALKVNNKSQKGE